MKKSKFTKSQILDELKRVEDGLSVHEICREWASALLPSISRVPNVAAWTFP